jgi:DtxR family Mn-dependent transcriptional regulator
LGDFLVEQAGYQIDEVHEEAENLEHSSSKRLVERLYTLMHFPKTDPHGSEIPAERFWEGEIITHDLNHAEVGQRYEVASLSQEVKDFLVCLNLVQPKFMTLSSVLSDGSVIVRTDDDARFVIPNFQKNGWQLKYYSL